MAAYVRWAARRVQTVGAGKALEDLAALRERYRDRKVVFFYWIEDVLPMMLIDRHQHAGEEWSQHIEFTCDDSYGGRVAESLLQNLGRRTLLLHWTKPVQRIRDLQTIVRSKAPMGIAVDGHGPYGRVGAGFTRLLDRCAAIAVPVSAVAERAWHVRVRARLAVPKPRTRLALTLGEAISDVGRDGSATERLQEALDDARLRSIAALADESVWSGARVP